MSLLEVKNLQHKFRDGTDALKGVSFSVEEGDFIVMKNGNIDHLFQVDANIVDNFTKAYQHFKSAN